MDSKRTQLLEWMFQTKIFKTSDILKWGIANFSNRAGRDARNFAELGLIRRLSKFELECKGIESKEGYYTINEKAIRDYLQSSLF